jgi:hypothetical protein
MADAAMERQQAKNAATAEIESKPRALDLALFDFTLIDKFRGFYDRGGGDYEVEPRHQVVTGMRRKVFAIWPRR